MSPVVIGDARLLLGDCLARMAEIPDGSVDMVLCDLPYGTTQNKWDAVIPFEPLWAHYWRILKPNGVAVLTAAQPFTSALVMSQVRACRYLWVWDKVNRPTGHLNAQLQPMRQTEDVVVFYRAQSTYIPQMTQGRPYTATGSKISSNYGDQVQSTTVCDGLRYPRNLLEIAADERGTAGRVHPTQKPVALMEYLIRTYTHEGETVLDNCFGSGTTGVACVNAGRKFIGIERDPDYFSIACKRIEQAAKQGQLFAPEPAKQVQLTLEATP